MSTMARMAPAWMVTLKSSERSPRKRSAISRCPVLEIGRNSVMPSMMPRMTVLRVSDTGAAFLTSRWRHLNRAARRALRAAPGLHTVSQLVAQVLQLEARQWLVVAARQGHELECLAHLLRHDQAARLAGHARVLQLVAFLAHHRLEAEPQQKGRL